MIPIILVGILKEMKNKPIINPIIIITISNDNDKLSK